MLKHLMAAVAAAALLCMPAASGAEPKQEDAETMDAVAKAGAEFAFKLLRRAAKPDQNAFFSPYSVMEAMAMVATGAEGETREEMIEALDLPGDMDAVNEACRAMRELLKPAEDAPLELAIANRLWGQDGVAFREEFLKTLRRFYGAPLGKVDFKGATGSAREKINAWVEKQTNGRIEDLVPKGALSDQIRLVLTNAVYFKAPWQEKFDADDTKDEDFTLADGDEVEVPMMRQKARFRHLKTDDWQAVELPYEVATLSMLVLLPDEPDGLGDLEKNLDVGALEKFDTDARRVPVRLFLPRFTMTRSLSLADMLRAMGIRLAFSSKADFSGMAEDEPLQISEVLHKAFVEVTEEGTEAAAATAVAMAATAAMVEERKPVVFRADRPFVFLIRDAATRTVLFIGRVADPR